MSATAHRVPISRRRYRCRWLFHCTAVAVLVVAGSWGSQSCAEERVGQADDASSQVPAYFPAEVLDAKALGAIRGKGGVDVLRPLINLGVILWDEGRGGAKPQAVAEVTRGGSIRGTVINHYEGVAIVTK